MKTMRVHSHSKDDQIFKLLCKDIKIPEDSNELEKENHDFKIDTTANLDDIVGVTLDYAKEKNLVPPPDKRVPQDFVDEILFKIIKIKPNKTGWLNEARANALSILIPRIIKFTLVRLLSIFINTNLQKLAESKLNKHFNNGALYNWFEDQIENVYRKHPEYTNITIHEFKKEGIWQQNAAEWRDKTKGQIIRRLSHRSITIIIMILACKLPLPFRFLSSLYAIPARILLAYVGCRLATGSINHFAVDFGNDTLILGISLTRVGFEIVQPELVVRRRTDGKMVRVELPDVPTNLYYPTKEEVEDFVKNEPSLEDIKKEVERRNDVSS